MAQPRLLFLNEDVPKRLVGELSGRGYNATSVYAQGIRGTLDPDLIALLPERYGDCVVLVTANESMPIEHAGELREAGLTVAVIDGRHEQTHQEAWKRDTVHRWAHTMRDQAHGTIRRYSPKNHAQWSRRRRRPQLRLK